MFEYLLALPEKREEDKAPARPTTLARRRKSSILITNLARGQEKPMPDLFTLVDLVLTSLRSSNQQTLTATLQLVSAILHNQHRYSNSVLVQTLEPDIQPDLRTMDAHNSDISALLSMAEDLIEHDDMAETYEAYLQDARTLIESHCCSSSLLALPGLTEGALSFNHQNPKPLRTVRPHRLDPNDPVMGSLIIILRDFFTNDITTNLRLTQAISTIASCGNTHLSGWLLSNSEDHNRPCGRSSRQLDAHDDENVRRIEPDSPKSKVAASTSLEETQDATESSVGDVATLSPVFAAIKSLVHQVEEFHRDIQDFDTYLSERHHVFKVGENIERAVANDVHAVPRSDEQDSREFTRKKKARYRNQGYVGSISERMMSETSSSSISRSNSPRGRQPSDSSANTFVDRLNHLRISPSPSPSKSRPRAFSPSPLGKDAPESLASNQEVPATISTDVLCRKIKIPIRPYREPTHAQDTGSETSSMRTHSITRDAHPAMSETKEVTLSHLLTNVIILQEFVLELAAIIQVRASLFGEVKFN